jgi:hypothetical protein
MEIRCLKKAESQNRYPLSGVRSRRTVRNRTEEGPSKARADPLRPRLTGWE